MRRKLSDENANSFLVKEEKVWCRIFALVAVKRQHMTMQVGAIPVKAACQP